jgi:cytochrome P450
MLNDASLDLLNVDLADPTLHVEDRVNEVFRTLRAHHPVVWNESRNEPGFWSVTRHADCIRVQKDFHSFGSVQTNVLGPHRVLGDLGAGKMLNATDPPRHTELRALVKNCFAPPQIAALAPYVRGVVTEVLDLALAEGECDFVGVIAMLPVAAISALLGVPRQDWPLMSRLTTSAAGSFDVEYQDNTTARITAARAHAQLLLYCRQLVEQRRHQPGQDVISLLISAHAANMLTEEEVFLFFDLLMLSANETTRHAATGAILALICHPKEWRRLRDDPDLVPSAVQEVLRWVSPSRHVLRRAKREVALHDRTIRAGEDIVIWNVSANRDERVFSTPDVFDVGRQPNPHLSFGSGSHVCLGSLLATLELRVFLEEFLRRVVAAELLAPVARLRSPIISGLKHLHVRLHPA